MKELVTKCSSPRSFAALIMASYGEGEPTDNAKAFMSELSTTNEEGIAACNFSVFGLGNSQCFPDRYNIVAKQLDSQLKKLGAKQVVELGLGDAANDMADKFEVWKEKIISTAVANASAEGGGDVEDATVSGASFAGESNGSSIDSESLPMADICLQPPMASHNYPVLSPRQLALIPSGREALLPRVASKTQRFLVTDEFTSAVSVTFDMSKCQAYSLTSSDVQSSPAVLSPANATRGLIAGDHIGVFSPNSSLVIKRFTANANISESQLTSPIQDDPNQTVSSPVYGMSSLHDVLKWQVQLSGPLPITTLKILLRWAKDKSVVAVQSAEYLSELIEDYDNKVRKRGLGIASVLAGICAPHTSTDALPIPVGAILKSLPVISPRLYSLTNDPDATTESNSTVTLLCRLLRYRDCASGSLVSGLCSSFLCERLNISDPALIFFRESNFHLPSEPSTPVIMICGGSGIAPFLSFLESRSNYIQNNGGKELAPAVLYFGSRTPHEYMFRSELHRHLEIGSLSRLVVGFSGSGRDSPTHHREEVDGLKQVSTHLGEVIVAERCNITDLVNSDTDEHLKVLMQQGAYVYVCGGAGHFGRAVRETVEQMVQVSLPNELADQRIGEVSKESSGGRNEGVRLLVNQKRYFEDLAD